MQPGKLGQRHLLLCQPVLPIQVMRPSSFLACERYEGTSLGLMTP